MSKTKKVFKIIGNILLLLLLLFVIFLVVMFAVHKHLNKKAFDSLSEAGYVNLVQARDYKVNVCSYGNENGKHKLVAISGLGIQDYSVTLRKVTDEFADDNLIIFPDRAGYGFSEDTNLEMTTENIVENYRAALKNAGFEAPYVLLPHSIGSAYATYWESKYPEEIEGIVFFDGTPLQEGDVFEAEDLNSSFFVEKMEYYACKLGLHRLVLHKFWYLLPENYSEEEQKLSDEINAYGGIPKSSSNEAKHANEICADAYNSIVTNDIPKFFINANQGIRIREEFDDNWNYVASQTARNHIKRTDPTDEMYEYLAEETIRQSIERTDTVLMPYLELLGNCECVNMPGEHLIYQQKPEECVEVLRELLDKID